MAENSKKFSENIFGWKANRKITQLVKIYVSQVEAKQELDCILNAVRLFLHIRFWRYTRIRVLFPLIRVQVNLAEVREPLYIVQVLKTRFHLKNMKERCCCYNPCKAIWKYSEDKIEIVIKER